MFKTISRISDQLSMKHSALSVEKRYMSNSHEILGGGGTKPTTRKGFVSFTNSKEDTFSVKLNTKNDSTSDVFCVASAIFRAFKT